MSKKIFFENIVDVGIMYLDYELFTDDYPVIFILSDDKSNLYFSICVDVREEQRWVLSRTNIEDIILLIENKITLRDMLKNEYNQCFIVKFDYETSKYDTLQIPYEEIDEDDLPEQGIVLNKAMERHMEYYKNLVQTKTYLDLIHSIDVPEDIKSNQESIGRILRKKTNIFSGISNFSSSISEFKKVNKEISDSVILLIYDILEGTIQDSKRVSISLDSFKMFERVYFKNFAAIKNIELPKTEDKGIEDFYKDDESDFDYKTINVSLLQKSNHNQYVH